MGVKKYLILGKTTEEFKHVTNAYDLLSNQEKRKQYDQFRQFSGGFSGFSGFNSSNNSNSQSNHTHYNNNSNNNSWMGGDYQEWLRKQQK